MKKGLLLFFIFSLSCYGDEERLEIISDEKSSQDEEVTLLEHKLISQPSNSLVKEMELPPPVIIPTRTKSPFIAVGLSSLIPGLGHVYLDDLKTAGAIFGSSGLGYGLVTLNESKEQLQYTGLIALQSTWFYNIYSVYRDTRNFNKNVGYHYKMPTESLNDLTLAPVNFSILKKTEVWGGLLGALSLGAAVVYFAYYKIDSNINCSIEPEDVKPLFAFPIGIGEETFFRGYMQSMLSETFTPWGGIVLTSLIFGAMHIPNAQALPAKHRWRYYSYSLPFISTLGIYFGWLTHKNKSLKESVALHVWYDFAIFLASSYAVQSAITKKPKFAICIPF